jgi:hypothetical protein
VELPVFQAVRPAFRLAEPQGAVEIGCFQASKSQSAHQKYRTRLGRGAHTVECIFFMGMLRLKTP